MPTDLPNNLVRTIPVIFERLMGGESAAEIAADYTREGAPLLPDDFAPIADAIARLRRLESRPVDPVAALRAVLAKNARIPHLEAEIAHLRKRDPSEELDAVQDALNEHPASPDIGDLSLAEQVRQIIKWWDETEVENNDAHNVLDELCAPDEGTPAKRNRALAAAKDQQIAELEEKVRALAAERTQATTERPDYLTPGASELACPQCGCVVYWQMHEVNDGAEGSAHCSRSSYTARAPSMPMVGDGGCEWHGRVRRVGGRVEVVT